MHNKDATNIRTMPQFIKKCSDFPTTMHSYLIFWAPLNGSVAVNEVCNLVIATQS